MMICYIQHTSYNKTPRVWQGVLQVIISSRIVTWLDEFDGCAGFFESFFSSFGVVFAYLFLYRGRCAVNDSFGFTEAKTRNVLHCLDDSDFLCASIFQGNGPFGFFFGGFGRGASGWAGRR